MKIKFTDRGEIVDILSAKELVTYMNSTSFTPAINNAVYMVEYARRAVISANEDIRATSEEEFMEDLEKYGHIIIVDGLSAN